LSCTAARIQTSAQTETGLELQLELNLAHADLSGIVNRTKELPAMKHLVVAAALLALMACTHETVKPKTKWAVKTSTESEQRIWITRPDGSRQCAKAPKIDPTQVATQVQGAGILVFESKTGTDGQMHSQMCGAATGRTIDLLISKIDIRKALALGFVTKENAPPIEAPLAPQVN
jgi:hypothetical protein